jgi:3-deoxy-D-manno-octulosonic-acid transferase
MYFSIKVLNLNVFYNIAINLTQLILKFVALFNDKIKLGVYGRSNTFNILKNQVSSKDKCLWYHCASLGEYEQGLPVFKELRQQYPNHKIILTFFSPSGYEIRKNTDIADIVVYLAIDTKSNARRFLSIINPELTIFVKYDIWPNYLEELKRKQLRTILISALFRKNQAYFKFYGGFMRRKLFAFEHIFTQDKQSKQLLESINYHNSTVSGDTRFDRVYSQLEQNNHLKFIEEFKDNKTCLIAGSTWPEDEVILIDYINNNSNSLKYIIAPHNIKTAQIQKLKEAITKKTVLFSEKEGLTLAEYDVFIVDTIGLLTKMYSYGNIAYVGGAIGNTGLHNTLEPAVFGIPIIIGNNYKKFPEAKIMIDNGGMFEVRNSKQFNLIMNQLIKNKELTQEAGNQNFNFIKKNRGAVIQIMNYIRI